MDAFDIYTNYDNSNNVKNERDEKLANIIQKNTPDFAHKSLILLCMEFSEIFHVEDDTPTVNNFYTQHLNLKDAELVYTRNYRLPQTQREEISSQVKNLLKNNLIV